MSLRFEDMSILSQGRTPRVFSAYATDPRRDVSSGIFAPGSGNDPDAVIRSMQPRKPDLSYLQRVTQKLENERSSIRNFGIFNPAVAGAQRSQFEFLPPKERNRLMAEAQQAAAIKASADREAAAKKDWAERLGFKTDLDIKAKKAEIEASGEQARLTEAEKQKGRMQQLTEKGAQKRDQISQGWGFRIEAQTQGELAAMEEMREEFKLKQGENALDRIARINEIRVKAMEERDTDKAMIAERALVAANMQEVTKKSVSDSGIEQTTKTTTLNPNAPVAPVAPVVGTQAQGAIQYDEADIKEAQEFRANKELFDSLPLKTQIKILQALDSVQQ